MPRFAPDALTRFAAEIFERCGTPSGHALLTAQSLVAADMCGYASHGLMRAPFYVDMIERGDLSPAASLIVAEEGPSRIAGDAQWGLGRVQCGALLDRLIPLVESQGVAVGTLRNCGHIGRLGEYCEIAAERGLISMLMVNTHGAARRVAPPGGVEPRLGTNPLAIGVPLQDGPLVLDFSTSATAEGKVRVHKIAGSNCPEGWLLDSEGRPTTDPDTLYGDPPGTILPMGGAQTYKGFGLALMVELLTGALSGGLCARETPETPKGNCVFLQLFSPSHFGDPDHFRREAEALIRFVRQTRTAEGVASITLPGDPERAQRRRAAAEGVAYETRNWEMLTQLAERVGVSQLPERLGE